MKKVQVYNIFFYKTILLVILGLTSFNSISQTAFTASIGENKNICQGNSASITISFYNGESPYNVSYTDGISVSTITVSGNDFSFNVFPQVSTEYKILSVTDKRNVSANIGKGTCRISVNKLPDPPVSAKQVSRCGPGNITVQASGSTGKYKWYDDYNSTTPVATGDSLIFFLNSNGQNVFLTAVDTTGCESYKYMAITTVISFPIPSAPVVTSNAVCAPGKATFAVRGGTDGAIYKWYEFNNEAAPLLKESKDYKDSTFSVQANYAKDYFVYTYNRYTTCKSEVARTSVNILPKPENPQNPNNPVTCVPGYAELAVDDLPNYRYNWYILGTDQRTYISRPSRTNNVSTPNPYIFINNNHRNIFTAYLSGNDIVNSYTVWVEIYDPVTSCVSDKVPVTATYYKIPAPIVSNQINICAGQEKVISAAIPVGLSSNTEMRWYKSLDLGEKAFSTSESITISDLSEGVYTYYASIVDFNKSACESDRALAEVTITVNASPESPSVVECRNFLYAISKTNAVRYRWYSDAAGLKLNAETNVGEYAIPQIKADQDYYVSAIDNNACESGKTKVVVSVVAPLTIASDKTILCKGDSVILTASGGSGFYEWKKEGQMLADVSYVLVKPIATSVYVLKDRFVSPLCDKTLEFIIEVDTSATCFFKEEKLVKDTLMIQPQKLLVEAYPNPFEEEIGIKLSNITNKGIARITLREMTGLEVLSFETSSSDLPFFIGTNLMSGFYSLEVECGGEKEVVRIVKIK